MQENKPFFGVSFEKIKCWAIKGGKKSSNYMKIIGNLVNACSKEYLERIFLFY